MKIKRFYPLILLALAIVTWDFVARPRVVPALADQAQATSMPATGENQEVARLFAEDQADRSSGKGTGGTGIDWALVEPRDRGREARVKELYVSDKLESGTDYYHAAMVLQHAPMPEDYLLAHELCIVAVSKGENRAKWLAAATEDRFLMSIKRSQRFGTQFRSDSGGPIRLYDVDARVTDGLRRAMGVPTLDQAKERETNLNKARGARPK